MTNHPFYPRPNTGPFDAARFERMRMEEQEERRRRTLNSERERREHRGYGEWYDDWLARYGYPPRSGSKSPQIERNSYLQPCPNKFK